MNPFGWLTHPLILTLVGCVKVYQLFLSPLFGRCCRFQPTCSQYMIDSLRKHGIIRGLWQGARRIARCHPWHPGGVDLP